MTQIIVLPHVELCPEGSVIEARPGQTICETLLENGIDIEHACEMSCRWPFTTQNPVGE